MQLPIAAVLRQLAAEGLLPPDGEERARLALARTTEDAVPWYVRVATGIGAGIASMFLVGFVVTLGVEPDHPLAPVVGAAMVAVAVFLRRQATMEFARQLALAGSFAGQLLLVMRVAEATESVAAAALVVLALSAALVLLVPDVVHRFMSAAAGSLAVMALAAELGTLWRVVPHPVLDLTARGGDLAALALLALAGWLWRGPLATRGGSYAALLEPVRYGVVVALLGVLLLDAWLTPPATGDGGEGHSWRLGVLTTLGAAAALGLLARAVARESTASGASAALPVVWAGVMLLAALTFPTPGIVTAAALLALAFDRRAPVLLGLGVLFLLAFLALHYYSLRLTLLEKSGVLVASGALLLGAGAHVARRLAPTTHESEAAP